MNDYYTKNYTEKIIEMIKNDPKITQIEMSKKLNNFQIIIDISRK